MVENNLYLEDGVYTALVTPFTEDYSIDLDSLTNLAFDYFNNMCNEELFVNNYICCFIFIIICS